MKVDWDQKRGFIEFCITRGDYENAHKLIDQEAKRLKATQVARQIAQLEDLRSQLPPKSVASIKERGEDDGSVRASAA
jgi:thioredoxin-like negative regulator of GroEL